MAWLTIIWGGTFLRKEDIPPTTVTVQQSAPAPALTIDQEASCCFKGGKKHDYQPRVTKQTIVTQPDGFAQLVVRQRWDAHDITRILEACTATKEEYHGEVCTWCGDIIHNISGYDRPRR